MFSPASSQRIIFLRVERCIVTLVAAQGVKMIPENHPFARCGRFFFYCKLGDCLAMRWQAIGIQ